jgi:hypothetical protein
MKSVFFEPRMRHFYQQFLQGKAWHLDIVHSHGPHMAALNFKQRFLIPAKRHDPATLS